METCVPDAALRVEKAPGMNQHRSCLQGGPRLGGEGNETGLFKEDGPKYVLTGVKQPQR